MDVGKDIYRVSVPMAAGAALAAIIFLHAQNIEFQHITLSVSALLTSLFLGLLLYLKRLENEAVYVHVFWIILFFLLGSMCFFSSAVLKTGSWPMLGLDGYAARLSAVIDTIAFDNRSSNALVKALILGDRSGMDRSMLGNFRNAGAAHLLALSGMHLGIIYLLCNRLLCIMGNSIAARKIRSAAVILFCGFYTLMCGCSPSLLRAFLFILLNESSKILERRQPPQHIFCAALTLHLIFQPSDITEVGFQLSYLAMVGIVFLWPYMKEWYPSDTAGSKIWAAASLSICCQAFTAPLTLYHFGVFPKYFLITNLVAAPLMGVVMICSIASLAITSAGILTWLVPWLEIPLTLLTKLMEIISSLP